MPMEMTVTSREASIHVAATPAEVFETIAAFADPPPFAAISRLSPRGGLGAVYQVDTRAFAASFTHVFTVDTFAPPRTLGIASVGRENFRFTVDYQVDPLDGVTSVIVRISAEASGRWRVVRPLLGGILQHAAHDAVSRVKALCENPGHTHGLQRPTGGASDGSLSAHASPASSDDPGDAPLAHPGTPPGGSTQEAGGRHGQI
ncbi:MAG: hypothetical protein QOJ31_1443 [Gaiellales bacterium]|nr:hypothetical protein [Gaiellales bacterium]